jgi:transposase
VWRIADSGEISNSPHTGLAKASGIETPTREDLARLDRKRKKKTSNQDWKHPWDPDAKIAKMKDGRTHLAHKAEHAVDLETGAMVAVTLQGADQGDTTTIVETAIAAADQIEDAQAEVQAPQPLEEIIADKGYHESVKRYLCIASSLFIIGLIGRLKPSLKPLPSVIPMPP